MTNEESKKMCSDDFRAKNSKWDCPNFKDDDSCTSMEYERYSCKVCGQWGKLYYDEMR